MYRSYFLYIKYMKISKFLNLKNLWEILMWVLRRFPVAVIILTFFAGLLFALLHTDYNFDHKDILWKAAFSSVIAFFLSTWSYIYTEEQKFSWIKKQVLQFFPIVFWILFYFWFSVDLEDIENAVFFLLTLCWVFSLLFYAPYIRKFQEKNGIFYSYFYRISVMLLISFIFGWILFALWAIWITAVDQLFDINFDGEIYWDWAILSMWFIAPLFALSHIPESSSFNKNTFNENMFFSFLVKYIAIPFISMYFLILYAYTAKVLLNFQDWPKGEVTWMVIWFSIFGYLAYIFSYVFQKKIAFIALFRKIFPYVVIPQIAMLFYAIYLRINQYDITINRYFVVVFGLWLLIISCYYIFSKKKKIVFIPAILTLFTIIISIWPWWIYSLPESRQFDRLENNLKKAWIIKIQEEMYNYTIAQEIVPLQDYSDISQDLSINIYSWIDYLCDFDNCNSIKELFPKIYIEVLEEDEKQWEDNRQDDIKRMEAMTRFTQYSTIEDNARRVEERKTEVYSWPNKWTIVSKITEKIKVKNYFPDYKNDIPPTLFFWVKWTNNTLYPIQFEGYDFMTSIISKNSWELQDWELDYMYWEVDTEIQNFSLKIWKKILETVSLKDMHDKLIILNKEKQQDQSYNWIYSKDELTFVIEWEKYSYKMLLQSINIDNPEYKEPKLDESETWSEIDIVEVKRVAIDWPRSSWHWLVLVKEK